MEPKPIHYPPLIVRVADPERPDTQCQWFLKCGNPATTTRSHPVYGEVPICGRCDDRMRRLEHGE